MQKKELHWNILIATSIFFLSSIGWCPFISAAGVPDTGQSRCYDSYRQIPCPKEGEPFYGQDGNYSINPEHYTKLGADGNELPKFAESWAMVRDNVTGLIWEVKQDMDETVNYLNPHDSDNEYTWYDPDPETNGGFAGTPGDGTDTEDFINALNGAEFGGFDDWRLPTVNELFYLFHYGKYKPGPTIADFYFPQTQLLWYWTSTTHASHTDGAWDLGFGYGGGYAGLKYEFKPVRAVRGDAGPLVPAFVDNEDGTGTDLNTGLMWQSPSPQQEYTWEEALAYAESLELAGYDDWRLPTIKELKSIIDYTTYDPAVDTTMFHGIPILSYWSSTTFTYIPRCALMLQIYWGHTFWQDKTASASVHAVRGPLSDLPD